MKISWIQNDVDHVHSLPIRQLNIHGIYVQLYLIISCYGSECCSLRVFFLCRVHCLYPNCWCFSWINKLNLHIMRCICSTYRETGWGNDVYSWCLSVQENYLKLYGLQSWFPLQEQIYFFCLLFHFLRINYILHAPGELPYEIVASEVKMMTQFTHKITYQRWLPTGAPF